MFACPSSLHNEGVQRDRVAIFGSGGPLGVGLAAEFRSRGCDVVGFERSTVDITDQAAVERAIAQYDPAVVINSAAYNQVDVAEKEPQAAPPRRSSAVLFFTQCRFRRRARPPLPRRGPAASAGCLCCIEICGRAIRP